MELHDFLDQYVEGYLFHDLASMERIRLPDEQHYGAVSWPIVLSVLSGMELLGALLFDHEFDADSGDTHFKHYWVQFLGAVFPEYKKMPGGPDLMRALVRHGLAHSFLTAPGINVTKGDASRHLYLHPDPLHVLSIDCLKLAEDFRESYAKKVHPIVRGVPLWLGPRTISRESMQQRLNQVARFYADEAIKHLGASPFTQLIQAGRVKAYPSSSVPTLTEGSMGPLYGELTVPSVGPGTQTVFPPGPKPKSGAN